VEFLHDLGVIRKLDVVVLGDGGWSWLVAWAQVGIKLVKCFALNDAVATTFGVVRATIAVATECALLPLDQVADVPSGSIVCLHASSEASFSLLRTLAEKTDCFFLISALQSVWQGVETAFGHRLNWTTMKHRRLGGLTSALVRVGWAGPGCTEAMRLVGQRSAPLRP
jgi:hypothetical protein